jgi:hypothetical protein
MRQLQTGFPFAVLIFAVVVFGLPVQVANGSAPADIVYAQPGQLVDQAAKPSPKEASRTAGAR